MFCVQTSCKDKLNNNIDKKYIYYEQKVLYYVYKIDIIILLHIILLFHTIDK